MGASAASKVLTVDAGSAGVRMQSTERASCGNVRPRRRVSIQLNQMTADALIAFVAMAWGSSYLLMKVGLGGLGAYTLIALRFCIAFLVVAVVFWRKVAATRPKTLARGAMLGSLLFGLFAFLTHGLETTTSSNGGFLTAMTVVLVPVFRAVLLRRLPPRAVTAGVAVSFVGIALLTLQGSLSIHPGDALCLVGAIVYAFQIILTDKYSHDDDGLLLGVWQLGFAGLLGLVFAFVFETPALPASAAQWGSVLGLALVCSAFGFVAQPVAQAHTTAEHTALLFALEPVFSAVLAFLVLGEQLSLQGYVGAALVLAGVVVASRKG